MDITANSLQSLMRHKYHKRPNMHGTMMGTKGAGQARFNLKGTQRYNIMWNNIHPKPPTAKGLCPRTVGTHLYSKPPAVKGSYPKIAALNKSKSNLKDFFQDPDQTQIPICYSAILCHYAQLRALGMLDNPAKTIKTLKTQSCNDYTPFLCLADATRPVWQEVWGNRTGRKTTKDSLEDPVVNSLCVTWPTWQINMNGPLGTRFCRRLKNYYYHHGTMEASLALISMGQHLLSYHHSRTAKLNIISTAKAPVYWDQRYSSRWSTCYTKPPAAKGLSPNTAGLLLPQATCGEAQFNNALNKSKSNMQDFFQDPEQTQIPIGYRAILCHYAQLRALAFWDNPDVATSWNIMKTQPHNNNTPTYCLPFWQGAGRNRAGRTTTKDSWEDPVVNSVHVTRLLWLTIITGPLGPRECRRLNASFHHQRTVGTPAEHLFSASDSAGHCLLSFHHSRTLKNNNEAPVCSGRTDLNTEVKLTLVTCMSCTHNFWALWHQESHPPPYMRQTQPLFHPRGFRMQKQGSENLEHQDNFHCAWHRPVQSNPVMLHCDQKIEGYRTEAFQCPNQHIKYIMEGHTKEKNRHHHAASHPRSTEGLRGRLRLDRSDAHQP